MNTVFITTDYLKPVLVYCWSQKKNNAQTVNGLDALNMARWKSRWVVYCTVYCARPCCDVIQFDEHCFARIDMASR
jgi:hypothetical protein